jgi:hypothetical protein
VSHECLGILCLLRLGILIWLHACPFGLNLQIDETAKDINEQLAQINADRAELLAYQALDKRQRGIEYALLDRELTSARKELSKVRAAAAAVTVVTMCSGPTHMSPVVPVRHSWSQASTGFQRHHYSGQLGAQLPEAPLSVLGSPADILRANQAALV